MKQKNVFMKLWANIELFYVNLFFTKWKLTPGNDKIVAVLRVFINKGLKEEEFAEKKKVIIGQIKNLISLGFGKIIIVANTGADKMPTQAYLEDLPNHPLVTLRKIPVGFTWCNALNKAIMLIRMDNKQKSKAGEPEYEFVLNISNEVGIRPEHLTRMLRAMDDSRVGVVGTSFDAHKGSFSGEIVTLGRSYKHPRNTMMLIRISAISDSFRAFEPWCDTVGGMEDIYFVIEMIAFSNFTYRYLNLKVPLIVGLNYVQATKEATEKKAMDIIIAYSRDFFFGTPERKNIDAAIAEMGIEEE